MTVYLDNRAENRGSRSDPRADIAEGSSPHPGYRRMLERHLALLGSYRFEIEPGFDRRRYKARAKDMEPTMFDDRWDAELERAIKHLHAAAAQPWRIDAATGKFVKAPTVTFDRADAATRKEMDEARVGDRTKKEIIAWLGPDYRRTDGVASLARFRNPLVYAFCNFHDVLERSTYAPARCEYDPKSGRIVNTRCNTEERKREAEPGFVCVTGVNWVFSHLLALGQKFKFSANATVIDAVLGLKQRGGKPSTPLYYNTYFKDGLIEPAFLLPWMDERDPDRYAETIKFLSFHEKVYPREAVAATTFDVKREIAEPRPDGRSFAIRYLPKPVAAKLKAKAASTVRPTDAGLSFHVQAAAGAWSPTAWTPREPLALSIERGALCHKVVITFADKEDLTALGGGRLLVSYAAKDGFCDTLGKVQASSFDEPYACKRGLHKCYAEIVASSDKLKSWNIVTMSDNHGGLEHSTLVIHKAKDGTLRSIHAAGANG